ncbi:MAG TPA: cyclodeaminase/cyclohydrolase family protein [Gaiellaceae bacterium]
MAAFDTDAATAAGPAAAQAGSAAASILRAAARDAAHPSLAAQAARLAIRLERLAAEDMHALTAARAALGRVGEEASTPQRDFALRRALESAAAVPLAIAETCADVVSLARELAPLVSSTFAPDVEGARLLAGGAARAAAQLVDANLAVGGDGELAGRAEAAARAAGA